ncbi:MAG: aminomethyltransferase family protein [Actinomycetota bacterium]
MVDEGFKNAFHAAEEKRGAEFDLDSGWYWTARFPDDPDGTKGYTATREDVSVWNVSPLIKWKFVGPDAAKAVDRAGTNKVEDLKVGGVRYSLFLDEDGSVLDEGTVYRVADDTLYFMLNTDGDEFGDELKKRAQGLDVEITNPSRGMPNLAIQGPNALALVQKLTDADVGSLRYFNFFTEPVEFAGAQVMLTRTGYSGEKGYEVFLMDASDADGVYEAVVDAGAYPIGTDAVLRYRVESGLVIAAIDYASEANPNTSPYDIGLGHAIKLDHDFVGKSGIEATASNPPNRYVTLKLEGDEESEYGAEVKKDGEVVGLAPSPTVSPGFGAITLATVPAELAEPGTELEVDGRKAIVDTVPLYDPEKKRPRS